MHVLTRARPWDQRARVEQAIGASFQHPCRTSVEPPQHQSAGSDSWSNEPCATELMLPIAIVMIHTATQHASASCFTSTATS